MTSASTTLTPDDADLIGAAVARHLQPVLAGVFSPPNPEGPIHSWAGVGQAVGQSTWTIARARRRVRDQTSPIFATPGDACEWYRSLRSEDPPAMRRRRPPHSSRTREHVGGGAVDWSRSLAEIIGDKTKK